MLNSKYQRALCFSGGAYNGTYHLGVARYVCTHFNEFDDFAFGGTSAGAFAAVVACLGVCTHTFGEKTTRIAMTYKHRPWRLAGELEHALLDLLPEDAYERCSGRVFIHILTTSGAICVTSFDSNEDLAAACRASSSIPGFTDRPLYRFRDMFVLDGGLRGDNCVALRRTSRACFGIRERRFSGNLRATASEISRGSGTVRDLPRLDRLPFNPHTPTGVFHTLGKGSG
jgi:predicted acylesterase/phospholipase RssA